MKKEIKKKRTVKRATYRIKNQINKVKKRENRALIMIVHFISYSIMKMKKPEFQMNQYLFHNFVVQSSNVFVLKSFFQKKIWSNIKIHFQQ